MGKYTANTHSYYQSLQFNGSNNYVNFGDVFDLGLANWTFEAWINAFDGIDRTILSKTEASALDHRYAMRIKGGSFTTQLEGSGAWDNVTSGVNVTLNEFIHLAWVIDRDGLLYMYINGEIYHSVDITQYQNTNFQTGKNFHVGSYDNTHNFFSGIIDEVRVWKLVRSQQQIQDNLNKSLIGDETGLVGYYPMNEGLGNVIYDHSGNGNHGTINGATWTHKVGYKPTKTIEVTSSPNGNIVSFTNADDTALISDHKYYIYTTTGQQTIDVNIDGGSTGLMDAFVVGGGGSGTGGGGGGGYVNTFDNIVAPSGQITISVGAGGPTPPSPDNGIDGEPSQVLSTDYISDGGSGAPTSQAGGDGGSGGGALGGGNGVAGDGGTNGGDGGDGTGGYLGGSGQGTNTYPFGDQNLEIDWILSGTKFGAGGGGATFSTGVNGIGGETGGGDGVYSNQNSSLADAEPFYGGGGGGRGNLPGTGGSGGSGIVILRHKITLITTAMEFTGGYLSIPHDTEHNINQFTLETYAKRPTSGISVLWFKRGDGNNGYYFQLSDTGELSFGINSVGGYVVNYTIQDSNFHHISFVYDVNDLTVYVDGVMVDIISVSSITITTMPTRIAAITDNDGSVTGTSNNTQTELRFWNVIRTQQEIQDNVGIRLNGDEVGLHGYWKMDEIVNGEVLDLTTNNNHAIVTGENNISIINI